jgi:hypothetical protein
MPWEGSDRRERLPDNWEELRREVFRRCGRRCEWRLPSGARCPRRATDVDHRVPGEDHNLRNLQGLCTEHHAAKSAQEGNRERWDRRQKGLRPPEEHPGALR